MRRATAAMAAALTAAMLLSAPAAGVPVDGATETGASARAPGAPPTATSARPADPPTARIVSTSGIPHHDIGDLRKSRWWRKGMPVGINGHWRRAIYHVIGQIASEQPDAVLHTGDMVGGRWGRDPDGIGMFGPVRNRRQRRRAVREAAALYYGQNKRWWAAHGLSPYFAVGDHEMGDMPPERVVPPDTFLYRELGTWRRAWARAFTDDGKRFGSHPPRGQHRRTAYATMIADGVGLVTLDPITRGRDGIRVRIGRQQLRWLDRALRDLRRRGARWLIVQSEAPALGPNRQSHSSRALLENGERVWQILRKHDVDLLLTAEFHEMTTHSDAGTTPVQVVHGGQMYRGTVNYLVVDVYDDSLELRLKEMRGEQRGTGRIVAPSRLRAGDDVRFEPGADVVGTMTIDESGRLSGRTGYLTEGFECSRWILSESCAAVREGAVARAGR